MVTTRSVHVVRCKDPLNNQNWVDVKVADAICITSTTKGGKSTERLLMCPAKHAVPKITDPDAGDSNPSNPTRTSHMVYMTSQDQNNSNMQMWVEVLDSIAFTGPHNKQWELLMPDSKCVDFVEDDTGHNLGTTPGAGATRKSHIFQLVQLQGASGASGATGSSGFLEEGSNGSAPFMCLEYLDSIAFHGPNHTQNVIMMPDTAIHEIDTTVYNADGSPPDNTDPNPYVRWGVKGGSAGPYIGATGIRQGLLWRIVNAPPGEGPWYWYVSQQPVQQPQHSPAYITFITAPGPDQGKITGSSPGFYFLSPYLGGSEFWTQIEPDPPMVVTLGTPIPAIGFDKLASAAWYGDASSASLTFPSAQYPPHGTWPGGYPNRVPNGAAVLPPDVAPAFPDEMSFVRAGHFPFANGPDFASFGLLPMTQPPTTPNSNTGTHILGSTNYANIWQMTNLPQPDLTDQTKPWYDPDYDNTPVNGRQINRYKPTASQMANAANEFARLWNAASASMNTIGALTGPDPGNTSGYTPTPDWGFGTPFLYRGPFDLSFLAGLCDSVGLAPILETFTSTFIAVGQLSHKNWDTSKYPPVLQPGIQGPPDS